MDSSASTPPRRKLQSALTSGLTPCGRAAFRSLVQVDRSNELRMVVALTRGIAVRTGLQIHSTCTAFAIQINTSSHIKIHTYTKATSPSVINPRYLPARTYPNLETQDTIFIKPTNMPSKNARRRQNYNQDDIDDSATTLRQVPTSEAVAVETVTVTTIAMAMETTMSMETTTAMAMAMETTTTMAMETTTEMAMEATTGQWKQLRQWQWKQLRQW